MNNLVDERLCSRDGCNQAASFGYQNCCSVCKAVSAEFSYAERLARRCGPSQLATDMWVTMVELSDQLSKYLALKAQLQATQHKPGHSAAVKAPTGH